MPSDWRRNTSCSAQYTTNERSEKREAHLSAVWDVGWRKSRFITRAGEFPRPAFAISRRQRICHRARRGSYLSRTAAAGNGQANRRPPVRRPAYRSSIPGTALVNAGHLPPPDIYPRQLTITLNPNRHITLTHYFSVFGLRKLD